jgi:hypothetical protein
LTITPAIVTLTAGKIYDGLSTLTDAVSIVTGIGSETLTYTGATASDSNVATGDKYINTITLLDGINGGVASNYTLPTLNSSNAAVTISAKNLTITGMNATKKTYDGTLAAAVTGGTLNTGITGEALTITGATLNDGTVGLVSTITSHNRLLLRPTSAPLMPIPVTPGSRYHRR